MVGSGSCQHDGFLAQPTNLRDHLHWTTRIIYSQMPAWNSLSVQLECNNPCSELEWQRKELSGTPTSNKRTTLWVEVIWCRSVVKDLSISQENNVSDDLRYSYALCTGFKKMKENSCIERERLNQRRLVLTF